jgi:hypothetical protein
MLSGTRAARFSAKALRSSAPGNHDKERALEKAKSLDFSFCDNP